MPYHEDYFAIPAIIIWYIDFSFEELQTQHFVLKCFKVCYEKHAWEDSKRFKICYYIF